MAAGTPRHIFEAIATDNEDAVKNFVEKRYVSLKNHDLLDQTVAHAAIKRDNISILKYLLQKDSYLVTAKDGQNFTILHRAAERGHLKIVKFLIKEYNMDPYELVEDKFKNSALHVAAQAGALNVVKYFIEEKRMEANLKNGCQQSPAFAAAFNLHFDIIRYLIEEQKVDSTGVDSTNDNILFPVVRKNGLDLVKYLLDDRQLKLDVNWKGNLGRTVTYWAAKNRQTELLSYFVEEKEADVNSADDDGWTPLHVAAKVGNLKTVKYLIEHKANFRIENKEGEKPADVCKNFHTKNYLDGVACSRGSLRRISKIRNSRSAVDTVPFAEPPVPLFFPVAIPAAQTELTLTKSGPHLFTRNIQHTAFDSFLIFVRVIFDIFERRQKKKHHLRHHTSPKGIEPLAMAAVSDHADVEN